MLLHRAHLPAGCGGAGGTGEEGESCGRSGVCWTISRANSWIGLRFCLAQGEGKRMIGGFSERRCQKERCGGLLAEHNTRDHTRSVASLVRRRCCWTEDAAHSRDRPSCHSWRGRLCVLFCFLPPHFCRVLCCRLNTARVGRPVLRTCPLRNHVVVVNMQACACSVLFEGMARNAVTHSASLLWFSLSG